MIGAINNGFSFNILQEDGTPFSIDFDAAIVMRMLVFAFMGSPQDFKTSTLVCRSWNVLGKEFYQDLYQRIAPHLFGKADYVKYIGGDPGEEFPVPLEYLFKFRPGETLLTFAPKELTFTLADGTVVVEPCNMENIGKWALNAKEGHPSGYHPNLWRAAIAEERPFEESHWSFIDIRLIEKMKVFVEQENAVLARGEALVGLSDLSLSLLMTHVKTGVRYLNWGETDTNYQFARVPEKTQGFRLCVGFAAAGLSVSNVIDDDAHSNLGVIVARKSFAHLIN